MATNARARRLEPAYKQHTAVDDVRDVTLDVKVTTGEENEGGEKERQAEAVAVTTSTAIKTITADQGRILRPTRAIEHGRFFYSKSKD